MTYEKSCDRPGLHIFQAGLEWTRAKHSLAGLRIEVDKVVGVCNFPELSEPNINEPVDAVDLHNRQPPWTISTLHILCHADTSGCTAQLAVRRSQLVAEQTRVANRIHKTLEDANVKLGSVATDILGVSGQDMSRFPTDQHLASWTSITRNWGTIIWTSSSPNG